MYVVRFNHMICLTCSEGCQILKRCASARHDTVYKGVFSWMNSGRQHANNIATQTYDVSGKKRTSRKLAKDGTIRIKVCFDIPRWCCLFATPRHSCLGGCYHRKPEIDYSYLIFTALALDPRYIPLMQVEDGIYICKRSWAQKNDIATTSVSCITKSKQRRKHKVSNTKLTLDTVPCVRERSKHLSGRGEQARTSSQDTNKMSLSCLLQQTARKRVALQQLQQKDERKGVVWARATATVSQLHAFDPHQH